MITDVHANVDADDRINMLRQVMGHLTPRDPSCVLNCGDISDYGVADEFALYRSCVPDTLWPRVHHVPGNHEEQWNADALEAYRKVFGPTRHSFDAEGLHFVGIDPLVSQEWSWHFSDDLLDWISDDLRRTHPSTPVVIFNHFPMAADWHYIRNAEKFFQLIASFPVRVLLAGHAHHLQVNRSNGFTQVVGDAIKLYPAYYWAERSVVAGTDVLTISQVTVQPDGSASEQVVANAPLRGDGPGGELGPFSVTHTTVDGTDVHIQIRTAATAAGVMAQVYPQGVSPGPWTPLTSSKGFWKGSVSASALPPGKHRLALRATDADGAAYDAIVPFELGGSSPRVAWTQQLKGRIQGDLAVHDGLVVAGTVTGDLLAFQATIHGAQPRWRDSIGGVYRGPAFSVDGRTLFVGTVDHHLYAYAADTGRLRWRRDLGAPIECDLLVSRIGGEQRVLAVAGEQLYCLRPSGEQVWRAGLDGTFAGQPACDGTRVFAASATSDALAFDGLTGERLWMTPCTDVDDAYHQILNGPWAARIRLAPSGAVLITTVTKVFSLDASTGQVQWISGPVQGGAYTPPVVTGDGLLAFEGGKGTAKLLDLDTGQTLWSDGSLPRSRSAAPIATADPHVFWMARNTGLLARIDVAKQTLTPVLQVTRAFTLSTGALVAGDQQVLVVGDKDGRLSGVVDLS